MTDTILLLEGVEMVMADDNLKLKVTLIVTVTKEVSVLRDIKKG